MEIWWSNVHADPDWDPGVLVQWPSKVRRYQLRWPENPSTIVLAHQSVSALFYSGDGDQSALVQLLQRTNEPVIGFLVDQLRTDYRSIVFMTNATPADLPDRTKAAIAGVNEVIARTNLYSLDRFAGVELPAEATSLLATSPQGEALIRLNRVLLEAVYGSLIGRSLPPVDASALIDASRHFSPNLVYVQNNPSKIGYNPNEEHAFIDAGSIGDQVYALRDDLNGTDSKPYVLHGFRVGKTLGSPWAFRVFKVTAGDPTYPGVAGVPIQPPLPISADPPLPNNYGVSGPYWKDRKAGLWAKAASDDGVSPARIVARFYYRASLAAPKSFYFPRGYLPTGRELRQDDPVPWLDIRAGTPGTPINVNFDVVWPPNTPVLNWAETLVAPKRGLPDIEGQNSVEVLYEQPATGQAEQRGRLVRLIDPIFRYSIDVPNELLTDVKKLIPTPDKIFFEKLPPHLQTRLWYDTIYNQIQFEGRFVRETLGQDYLLPNILTARDNEAISKITEDSRLQAKLGALATTAKAARVVGSQDASFAMQALTAGFALGSGYVTMAFGNNTNKNDPADPVSLSIIKVGAPLFRGEIKAIAPPSPFDEKLTLRHSGDFAGKADEYEFDWRYKLSTTDTSFRKDIFSWAVRSAESSPSSRDFDQWDRYPMRPVDGAGAQDVTIEGANLFTLGDVWFVCRYRPRNASHPFHGQGWSPWTEPQLAEGWIKRVVKGINEFNFGLASVSIEDQFASYQSSTNNKIGSMLALAGKRYEGDVAFNLQKLGSSGLIQIYETVLRRGEILSISGNPAQKFDPANTALLLAASRIASLYTLLGNEAFADASDPTLAFGSDASSGAGVGADSTSLFAFMNQVPTLLDEELALLRGRNVQGDRPVYNRLPWNFTLGAGQAAYVLNYNIRDVDGGKGISAEDAAILYPQGHGDAWGHYLSAQLEYYRLLHNTNFTWVPRSETILLAGRPVDVDYQDEQLFARIASAKAHAGSQIVNLTYRKYYTEDPNKQWLGYDDEIPPQGWGIAEWAERAGQAAYIDWVTGNALLRDKDVDPNHTQDIQKIDRTRVLELAEIPAAYKEIEAKLDEVDLGLNPLGLGKNAVPFDISLDQLTAGKKTHFEQIYERAVDAINNAYVGFGIAQNAAQVVRKQADSLAELARRIDDQEWDFRGRLIEAFGYPYRDDVASKGGIYTDDYVESGPDIYHYMLVDPTPLLGNRSYGQKEFTVNMLKSEIAKLSGNDKTILGVKFWMSTDGFGLVKPAAWTHGRRAPGEIQNAHADLLQVYGRFLRGARDYDNLLQQIDDQGGAVRAQAAQNSAEVTGLNTEISILTATKASSIAFNDAMAQARARQVKFQNKAAFANIVGTALAEALPTVSGIDNDWTAPARSAIRLVFSVKGQDAAEDAASQGLIELDQQQAKELVQTDSQIQIRESTRGAVVARGNVALEAAENQLAQLIRSEASLRLELYNLVEALEQAAGRYTSALTRGIRLIEEVQRFRAETAADLQEIRYKDMTFRIFRNDNIQKFRAQFDLAAEYCYLAAIAYDYETGLLGADKQAGQKFLQGIVRTRSIGQVANGRPQVGGLYGDPGLADAMARMSADWSVVKGRFGIGNPANLPSREFSLRREVWRIHPSDPDSSKLWRATLKQHRVANVLDLPEYQKYCLPIPGATVEPALVIPMGSSIQSGANFFGWPLGPGDNVFPTTHFAVKLRTLGVSLVGFDGSQFPAQRFCYVLPIGLDVMRSPADGTTLREWRVLDQAIPLPQDIGGVFKNPGYIPVEDSLGGLPRGTIRLYPEIELADDAKPFSDLTLSSRYLGRSVWNTEWLLIIPGRGFNTDPEAGLDELIDGRVVNGIRSGVGISDIRIRMDAYSYSGN